ncbi:hypothetical protein [Oceanobacillus halotolerans]|uniref:hypothetical protein n=1 Tax=Oceanobacillus halotolerans TaxID=2663380 RepID=UPI0013D91027|nr:hypothetical protein [Oceanobacillus halotolerans]
MKEIYFLFTDTGTYLSKGIHFWTKEKLNHVSIAFDKALTEVYSFGRKNPRNPFSGGFVKEDIRSEFFKQTTCAIYSYRVTEVEYKKIRTKINQFEAMKNDYKYNFIGLFGILLQIEWNRDHAMFCSQFIGTILRDIDSFQFQKPACFLTPADIWNHEGMQFFYQGNLHEYIASLSVEKDDHYLKELSVPRKPSFVLAIPKKVKQFVIR